MPPQSPNTLKIAEKSLSRTHTSIVYERLRRDIVQGNLSPGMKIKFNDTRRNYDVGLSPLREALMQLRAERLVTLTDQRGFRVAPVSKADMLDIMHLRQELDGMALRLSIENGHAAWKRSVADSFQALSEAERDGSWMTTPPNQRWEEHHREFHRSLGSACESPWLIQFCNLLFDQADRYRWLSFKRLATPRNSAKEHKRIFEEAMKKNASESVSLLREHLARTAQIVMKSDENVTIVE